MAQSNETFNVTIGANMDVSGVLGAVKQMQGAFNGLKLPQSISADMIKDFNKLQESLKKFETIAKQEHFSKTDLKTLDKLQKEIDSTFGKLTNSFNELKGQKIYLEADYTAIKNAQIEIDKLKNDVQTKLSEFKIDFSTASGGTKSLGLDEMIQGMERGVKSSKVLSAAMAEVKQSFQAGNFDSANAQLSQIVTKANSLKGAGSGLLNVFKQWGLVDFSGSATDLVKTSEGARLLQQGLAKIIPEANADSAAIKKLSEEIVAATEHKRELEQIGQNNIANMAGEGAAKMAQLGGAAQQAAGDTRQLASSINDADAQIKQLQQSTQYFFSLRNMINLLKRGIHEAIDTVKELDAAMTETAVVTDFSVSDMWEKLPEYTANANALGASVKDMYEATTLYYQQGLNTEQSMSIAAETMKMARIGGLEAADATDKMTAALRGFNMELNEASAQRVNDVYSNLAAKTASDTEELGTAMQRTASIAASAGMSFEGTAAFLAQAIETTREPAENLGTAMKTIVARFTELKKNPLEITEVDGEEVDYNKVDTALQSIGVSLKDTNGQFRELDQVFLDIAQRWNSLSQTQQRYVATTAAGSRQQSRFIAMMSNYERTVQLMDYANNSAGASNEQFGKTMESLEAKLNKLKNAWQQFEMGIADNSIIKASVDGLTSLISKVNDLINILSFGGQAKGIKSFLSIFTAFTALKGAGRIANSLIGGLGGLVDPKSSFGAGFGRGMTGNRQAVNAAQAAAIYQPIVRAIYDTSNREIASENQQRAGAYDAYNAFKNANQDLRKISQKEQGYTASEIINQLNKSDPATQRQLMKGLAGTEMTLTNSLLNRYRGGGKDAFKGILQTKSQLRGMRNAGQLSDADYLKALSDPKKLLQYVDSNAPGKAAKIYLEQLDKSIQTQAENSAIENHISNMLEEGISQVDVDAFKNSDEFKKATEAERERILAQQQIPVKNDPISNTLDGIGKFGSGVASAGMGIQAFAGILSASANPALQTFGTMLSSIGGVVTGLGMTISGVSNAFTAVASSSMMEGLFGTGAAATAATGGLFAFGAALLAIIGIVKAVRTNIRKQAEEITTNYKEKSEKNQTNIANLNQWREELAVLSRGVDSNGLNVSLNDSDYQRYLEITEGIAEINPAIVKGYNMQGHAIVDNNKALEETLSLERQRSKELLNNYTNTDAWTKLLKARNLERTYAASGSEKAGNQIQGSGYELKPKNKMRQEAKKIGQQLKNNRDLVDLTGLDIDVDALVAGGLEATDAFIQNYDLIKQRVNRAIDSAGEDWAEHSRNAIQEGFSAYGEAAGELDELIGPMYESMSAYATQSGKYGSIDEQLKSSFQSTLKNLASDANIETESEMRQAVDNALTQFTRLGTEYNSIMKEVDAARDSFARDFNETQYVADTKDAINDLENLKKQFEGMPGESALTQWVDNEIAKIKNHTTDGVESVAAAWNTLSDEITAAEAAYDDFSKKTEKDYASAADSMRQIYEAATAETDGIALHAQGKGDNTYWTAAESLFGDLTNKTKADVDQMFADIAPMMQQGQAGFDAFFDRVVASNDALKEIEKTGAIKLDENGWIASIDDSAHPEVWEQVADALGISEQLLVSMLSKGQQFLEMDFTDYKGTRTALANDSSSIKAQTRTTFGEGEEGQLILMPSEELKEYMSPEQYNNAETRAEKESELLEQAGVKVLQEAKQFNADNAKELASDLGINLKENGSHAVTKELIDKIGQKYNQDDLFSIAKATEEARKGQELTGDDLERFRQNFNETYGEYAENLEYPTLQPLQSIESLVSQIAASVNQKAIESGNLTAENSSKDALKENIYGQRGVNDTLANRFKLGQDAEGNELTKSTYETSLRELQSLQASTDSYLEQLKTGLANAGSESEKALYESEIKEVEAMSTSLSKAIAEGIEKYKQGNETQDKGQTPVDGKQQAFENSRDKTYVDKSDTWERTDTTAKRAEAEQQIQARWEGFFSKIGNAFTTPGTGQKIDESKGEKLDSAGTKLDSSATSLDSAAQSFIEIPTNINLAATNLNNSATALTAAANHLKGIKPSTISTSQGGGSKNSSPKETHTQNTSTTTAKVVGQDKINTLARTIGALQAKTIPVQVAVSGLSQLLTVKNTLNSLKDKVINIKQRFSKTGPQATAKGTNNKILKTSLPSFGSAAKGHKGTVGPKNKGGLTLTGEEGFEIGWIPSENRSVILGMGGPQMVDLPKEAVIFNHAQSQEIIKRKSIPAGSSATGKVTSSSSDYIKNRQVVVSSSSSSAAKKTEEAADKSKEASKKAEEAAKKAKELCIWWENIARLTEATQRRADKNQKAYEKYIAKLQSTLKTTGTIGQGNAYIASLNELINYNQQQVDRANAELAVLGSAAKTTTISYRKNKNDKKDKEEKVPLAPYIMEQNGTWVLNEAAIYGIKNKDKRNAIAEAAAKEIDDRISKRNKAEDAIEKAQESLEEFSEKLYETFFAWENELTKVWNLTQKINALETKTSRFDSFAELLTSQLSSGMAKATDDFNRLTTETFQKGLEVRLDKIEKRQENVGLARDELEKTLTLEDEKKELANIRKKLASNQAIENAAADRNAKASQMQSIQDQLAYAEAVFAQLAQTMMNPKSTKKQINEAHAAAYAVEIQIAELKGQLASATEAYNQANANYSKVASQNIALNATEKAGYTKYEAELSSRISAIEEAQNKYITVTRNGDGTIKVDFKSDLLDRDKSNGLISKNTYDVIKQYADSLIEANNNLEEAYESLTKDITDLYQTLTNLRDQYAENAESLVSMVEEGDRKRLDELKKLSDSLQKAFKNLIDEVKRKLDERRQQEDNNKTVEDISKKQQRLAALRADTSGGHRVEIAQLEKEIAEAQQNYQRSLEDQLLDKLQQQGDEAAKQRERQIELQEALVEATNNAALVDLWLSNPSYFKDEIEQAYKNANNYNDKTQAGKDKVDRDFEVFYNGISDFQEKQAATIEAINRTTEAVELIKNELFKANLSLEQFKEKGYSAKDAQNSTGASLSELRTTGKYTAEDFATSEYSYQQAKSAGFSLKELAGTSRYKNDALAEAKSNLDKAYSNYYYSNQSSVNAFEAARKEAESLGINTSGYNVAAKKQQQVDAENKRAQQQKIDAYNNALANLRDVGDKDQLLKVIQTGKSLKKDLNTIYGDIVKGHHHIIAKRLSSLYGDMTHIPGVGGHNSINYYRYADELSSSGYSRPELEDFLRRMAFYAGVRFATGGLANFTGPAWLDGTPSKPELVLNAQDTKNFIALKDVLSHAMGTTKNIDTSYGGDNIYEININVDKIEKDYDVDRVAERVKKIIVKDSSYRNVTQVRNFR